MREERITGTFSGRLDRRHAARTAVEIEAYAYDDDAEQKLGRIIDLSPVGLKIRGLMPLPRRRVFALRLVCFRNGVVVPPITVKAICHWARECRDAPVEQYESGLSFESVSARVRARIRALIDLASKPG